ncbi:MAG: hypothetical protein KA743_05890, partial [Geothrix sp.]|nr:hypothetical protein [Geothrix sp.]
GLEQAKRLVLLSLGSWTAQEPPTSAGRPVAAPATAPPRSAPDPVRISAPRAGFRLQAFLPRPPGVTPEAATLIALLIPGEPTMAPASIAWRPEGLLATLDAGPEMAEAAAWSLLRLRLEALRLRGFTAADLERARIAWAAARSLSSLDAEAQLDAAAALTLGHGATLDRMKTLTQDQLNATLRAWLDVGKARRGLAGSEARQALPPRP